MFSTSRTSIIALLICFSISVLANKFSAQKETKSDSLKNLLSQADHDTTKIQILIDLGLSYGSSHEKNLYHLTRAFDLAAKTNNVKK